MKKLRLRSLGAVAVEFAIVLVLLLTLVFAAVEFGRAMFVWSSAVDATRRGARMAAIAAVGDRTRIVDAMYLEAPSLPAEKVTIAYSADGSTFMSCDDASTCEGISFTYVRVGFDNYTFATWIPFVPASIPMPAFSTTLPVEALGTT